MFDFFRKHMRLMQFALVLLILPSFVFFGIQGYSRFGEGGNATVAKVAGQAITRAELDAAHRDQIERVRRQMPNIDAKLFDSPEMKQRTLDELIRERVTLAAADQLNLATTDDRLRRLFVADPQFAFLRNADGSVNKDALAQQGMSSEMFAARLAQDIARRQVMLGVAGTVLAPASATSAAMDALLQQREIQVLRFNAKDYAAKINASDAELDKYYKDPAHAAQFMAPEQAAIEYVVLDLDALKKGVSVSDDELRKYYEENAARYTAPEERRARHILIKAEKDAPAADRAKAKARAEALLAELKKNPAAFAEVAKKNSDDPGSAERGGDLDFFGRGAMVKPFEDAAFALKPGEISPVVESDFGYHIIQLTAMRGGEKRGFDSVRGEIEAEVKGQVAQRRFTEAAVEFTNTVYEQPDSLKPVADKLKLEVRSQSGVQRAPAAGATGPLASPKFLDQLFGNDALRNKRNTEAIETAPNQLVAGRIVSYSPAHLMPYADVKAKVQAAVVAEMATAQARKDGEARLDSLKKAPQSPISEPPQVVSRAQRHDLPPQLIDAVLRADAASLPAFVGVDLGTQGYAVARIDKVLGRDPAAGDPRQLSAQYAQAWGDAEAMAYYSALKTRFKVDVKAAAFGDSGPDKSASAAFK
jgi:peptidyl-prolyl cis-trans isomerase D